MTNEICFSYKTDSIPCADYPAQEITFKITETDINIHQYYHVFRNFLSSIGFSEYNIIDGALKASVQLESAEESNITKAMEKYGVMDMVDHDIKVSKLKEDIECYQLQIKQLKAKISRLENPNNPQYTDEEIEIMSDEIESDDPIGHDYMIKKGFEMTDDGFWIPKSK
jgi:hypothetical protein